MLTALYSMMCFMFFVSGIMKMVYKDMESAIYYILMAIFLLLAIREIE